MSENVPAADSLEAIRLALAPSVAEAAVFDGWGEEAVASAAALQGVDPAVAAFAFGDCKPMDLIAAWIARVDADMAAALPAEVLAGLPIRERITRLVQFRLDAVAADREALRRALAIMAMPANAPRGVRLGWHSADAMWRCAGDSATDFNHYTKRATLAAIYAATLAVFANDESENHAETRAFLARRIEGVMRFEKAKARLLRPHDERFSVTRLLGRLRYRAT